MGRQVTAFLGIDGGGSHTRAVMADADGRIIGSGVGASVNPRHHDAASRLMRFRCMVGNHHVQLYLMQ